jgi:hypothetical protein
MKVMLIFDSHDLLELFSSTLRQPPARVMDFFHAHLASRIAEVYTVPMGWLLFNKVQHWDGLLRNPDFLDAHIHRSLKLNVIRPIVMGMTLVNIYIEADSLYITFEE